MALRVKIDPVERDIAAIISRDLSRAEQQKAAGAFAREGIERDKAHNRMILGRVPPLTIWVDGRQGAALDTVNPNGGSIVGEFELIGELLQWIADTLVQRSPVQSGAYRDGHTLFADGAEVPKGTQIPAADEYVFTNLVPYARKIEVGKTKTGRAFVVQVKNRIYERTAKDAKSRFGNQADIRLEYRAPVGAYRLKHNQAKRAFLKGGRVYIQPGQSPDRVAGSPVSPPAIVIRARKN